MDTIIDGQLAMPPVAEAARLVKVFTDPHPPGAAYTFETHPDSTPDSLQIVIRRRPDFDAGPGEAKPARRWEVAAQMLRAAARLVGMEPDDVSFERGTDYREIDGWNEAVPTDDFTIRITGKVRRG